LIEIIFWSTWDIQMEGKQTEEGWMDSEMREEGRVGTSPLVPSLATALGYSVCHIDTMKSVYT
jgi:hypothetical protein